MTDTLGGALVSGAMVRGGDSIRAMEEPASTRPRGGGLLRLGNYLLGIAIGLMILGVMHYARRTAVTPASGGESPVTSAMTAEDADLADQINAYFRGQLSKRVGEETGRETYCPVPAPGAVESIEERSVRRAREAIDRGVFPEAKLATYAIDDCLQKARASDGSVSEARVWQLASEILKVTPERVHSLYAQGKK